MSALDNIKKVFYDMSSDKESALHWALVRLDKDYSGQNRGFIEQAAAELAALEAVARVLENIEWEGCDDWGAYCPECKGYKADNGHKDYCELAAALAELEKVRG